MSLPALFRHFRESWRRRPPSEWRDSSHPRFPSHSHLIAFSGERLQFTAAIPVLPPTAITVATVITSMPVAAVVAVIAAAWRELSKDAAAIEGQAVGE